MQWSNGHAETPKFPSPKSEQSTKSQIQTGPRLLSSLSIAKAHMSLGAKSWDSPWFRGTKPGQSRISPEACKETRAAVGYDMDMTRPFKVHAPFSASGDQPQAIAELVKGIQDGAKFQTLLGVTGSGKTFSVAKVVEAVQKPTLVISHNKTLAAQLYGEFKQFFPENAVEYFVSYYDYYQPEAYVPTIDLYIEKDASINEEIERLRLGATSSLIERRDVLVVASVSCIYNIGEPWEFKDALIELMTNDGQSRRVERSKGRKVEEPKKPGARYSRLTTHYSLFDEPGRVAREAGRSAIYPE